MQSLGNAAPLFLASLDLTIQGLQLAVDMEEILLKLIVLMLDLRIDFHLLHDALHFLDALLQLALLAEMVALRFEKLGKAIALSLFRAIFVGNAFFDRRFR